MFVIFNYCLLFIALAIAIIDGFALFKSYVHGTSFGQKFINILHIGFAVIAMALIVVYIPYVNHLNTYEFTSTNNADVAAQAKAWSSFAFKSLTGVETRSSAPVTIVRDRSCQALGIEGLYPCGEGAGYAGGIMSAAADGIRCAQALINSASDS